MCECVCLYRYINGPWLFLSLKWYFTQTFIQHVGKLLQRALILKEQCTYFCNECEQPVEAALLQWLLSFLSQSRRDDLVLASSLCRSSASGFVMLAATPLHVFFWQENPPKGTNESWNPFLSQISLYRFCSVSNGTLFLTEETNGGSMRMLLRLRNSSLSVRWLS